MTSNDHASLFDSQFFKEGLFELSGYFPDIDMFKMWIFSDNDQIASNNLKMTLNDLR